MGGRNNIEDSIEGLAGLGVICFEVVFFSIWDPLASNLGF